MYYQIAQEDMDDFLKSHEVSDETDEKLPYTIYSQNDPEWKNVKLGNSNLTIGNYGCYITSLGMLSNTRPDIVNDLLKKEGLFKGALLNKDTKSLNKIAETLELKFDGINTDGYFKPDFDTIKEVRMRNSQHFVLRVYNDGKPFIIDSWDGKQKDNLTYPFASYRLFKK